MKKIKKMGWALKTLVGQANENDISFFDIKTLYDAAYEEKEAARESLRRYTALKAQAETLEAAYRAQLAARKAGPSVGLMASSAHTTEGKAA